MSKYIIEIEEKPLCVFDKDTQTYFPRLWRVKGFNSLVFDEDGLSRLEELNSDYIKEHFGDLQDEAYERGHGIGYQKGFEDGKAVNDKGCEGCQYAGKVVTGPPCISCCNSYKNQWTAKSDKIEVGDELIAYGGSKCIATVADYEKDTFYVMFTDGSCGKKDGEILKKTGRHFDIASILEDMRND